MPPGVWIALLLAALAGPVLLIVADFTTLFEVRGEGYLRQVSGHSNHGFAMVVIGGLALAIALLGLRRRIPAALAALAALGLAAAVIALAIDLPDATGSGVLRTRQGFQEASLAPRTGFYLETLGAALLLVAGVGGVLLAAPARLRGRGEPGS